MIQWLAPIGLLLDLIGVIVLFKYALPPAEVNRLGQSLMLINVSKEETEIDRRRGRLYHRRSVAGIVLITLGFALQAIPAIRTALDV